jgi:hypothetical protein
MINNGTSFLRAYCFIIISNINTPNPPGRICNQRVLTHAKTVFCTLCQSISHINCLNLYSPSDLDYTTNNSNNWSCPRCLRENVPFYQIDDRSEFISLSSPYLSLDHPNLDQLILNPYDINEEGGSSMT